MIYIIEQFLSSPSSYICLYLAILLAVFRLLQLSRQLQDTRPVSETGSHQIKQDLSKNEAPFVSHSWESLGYLYVPLGYLLSPLKPIFTHPAFRTRQSSRIKVLFKDIFVIQGAVDQISFLKNRDLSSFFVQPVFLGNAFELPKSALDIYYRDNSGENVKPLPGSNVPHDYRIQFHNTAMLRKVLMGPGLTGLSQRIYANATKQFSSILLGEESGQLSSKWEEIPDFLDIFKHHGTSVVVNALAGPTLLKLHPSFLQDLWDIDKDAMVLLMGLPSVFGSKGRKARTRALDAICDWHQWAEKNFTPDYIDKYEHDPFWGTCYFREKQEAMKKIDGFTPRAIASEDLSVFWIATSNMIVSMLWLVVEAYRNTELLRDVREEVQSCLSAAGINDDELHLDIGALLKKPLVQAMFAESLRICVHGFILRYSPNWDIRINKWILPRKSLALVSSTTGTMDSEFWCSEERGGKDHPVSEFWPGRFLKRDPDTNKLQFSMEGTSGRWLPFGGGSHMCPGRVITKQHHILVLALMVTWYDCEFLVPPESIKMNMNEPPLGSLPPMDKVPVKLRRREILPIKVVS